MDKTFAKGLRLIEMMAASEGSRGVTSLSAELKLTKSNVHRLLTTLLTCGYVQKSSSGNYVLSTKIWQLGVLVRAKINLSTIAADPLRKLAARTGESVELCILDGLDVVYLDKIESRQAIVARTSIGGRGPAYCLATGKAMLAFATCDLIGSIGELSCYTDQTIMTKDDLLIELQAVRSRGYAVNRGEWQKDVFGIAAPIFDERDGVAGAVGLWGPSMRFSAKQLAIWGPEVMTAAKDISYQLGHRATPRTYKAGPRRTKKSASAL